MFVQRILIGAALAASAVFGAAPASAQFFLKSPTMAKGRVTGTEPGILGQAFPDATPKELRAAMVWNLRAALNVAALQCQFEPTLLTIDNYNALLNDHGEELKTSYATLGAYFTRVNKTKAAGQQALDRYGTRIYSGFSTVSAQYTFCQIAAAIGDDAAFVKKGELGDLAADRMRELRASLVLAGEQQFPSRFWLHTASFTSPPFADKRCWGRDGSYNARKCGAYVWARKGA
jgi:hypothetical protein